MNRQKLSLIPSLLLVAALTCLTVLSPEAYAESEREPSFLPTWKLLNKEGKQQFMAGYLQGWRAASRVTELATEYIRKNPKNAVSSLESLSSVYKVKTLPPDVLVTLVDDFYSDPANREASLSMAVTAASGSAG